MLRRLLVARTVGWLYESRQRRLAVTQQKLGIQLDAPSLGREARNAIGRSTGVLPFGRINGTGYAFGLLTQLLDAQAQRLQHVVPAGLDAATEELLA